jgi:murein DD-endopeptidase MepM/ murein hydrolase activator NlpD
MKLLLSISLIASSLCLQAQKKDVEVYHETQDDNSLKVFARNNTRVIQSVQIEATFKGMKVSDKLPMIKVVDPGYSEYFFTLTPEKGSYSYNYKFTYIKGDVSAQHNDDVIYRLPYSSGKSFKVDQGYNETPTHMNQYALDFHMDERTEITAIRDGVVMDVEDDNSKGCPREECSKFNNYIMIRHEDGSVADYSHLMKNGAKVKIGDQIKAGDPIALSGDTGFASGPHLHLEVYVMTFNGQKSVKVEYHLDENTIGIPKSGRSYTQAFD